MAKKQDRKIRYAVVGLGHIAQVAVLPAFAHARRNSELVAAVSDDPVKRREVAARYKLKSTYSYADYSRCLEEVDAIYLALPNSMHEEYTVKAAKAGVHVLCEKPMAVTAAECGRMIRACRRNHVKLMIAYRLHFEELNLKAIDLVREGRIGDPRYFNSSFSMVVRDGNIRTKGGLGGGTLYDIGVYCINAARYLFRSEPVEVCAMSAGSDLKKFEEIDESTAAVLRFSGGRLAAFVTSFNAADRGTYTIVGTKGHLTLDPAYEYAEGLSYELTSGEKKTRKSLPKRDQFAPELLYFSDCILEHREPEPSGEEGMQDVKIVEALYKSASTGRSVKLRPFSDAKPDSRQRIRRPGIAKPKMTRARSGHR